MLQIALDLCTHVQLQFVPKQRSIIRQYIDGAMVECHG